MHPYYVISVHCSARSLGIWPIVIWCLGFIVDLIAPEGEAFLEAPLAKDFGCGPYDNVMFPEDGELVFEVVWFLILSFECHLCEDGPMIVLNHLYEYFKV